MPRLPFQRPGLSPANPAGGSAAVAVSLAGLLACLLAGCSHAQPPQPTQPPQLTRPVQDSASPQADLLSQLRGLERSCGSQAQCRTVPVGAKPCGGPEGYLPYSTARNDPARVAELAARHRAERAADNQRRGIAGDCMLVPDPGAVCRAGNCELGGNPRDK